MFLSILYIVMPISLLLGFHIMQMFVPALDIPLYRDVLAIKYHLYGTHALQLMN